MSARLAVSVERSDVAGWDAIAFDPDDLDAPPFAVVRGARSSQRAIARSLRDMAFPRGQTFVEIAVWD